MTETEKKRPEYSPDLLYKFLREGGRSPIALAAWSLPSSNGEPGEWMPRVKELEECASGYHLCRERGLVGWAKYPALYVAEGRGSRLERDSVVYESARLLYRLETWTERNRSLWAADCAEHVLHLFEDRYPADVRPRRAIESTRAYWSGAVGWETVHSAYVDAFLAGDAAASDAGAAHAAYASAYVNHTRAAAVNAVYASNDQHREREWQLGRLLEYLWPGREEEE